MIMSEKHKQRNYARNRLISRKGRENVYETDSAFLLKLIIVVLLGVFWLKFNDTLTLGPIRIGAFPVGFFVGLLLVNRLEKLQFNRKIWYVVLVLVTVISYFASAGIVV